ncbi:MAG: HD domain-containing protein [Bacteroidales bacterium]|nr:HD domain-containing protein [Bacteroidales bacterium]
MQINLSDKIFNVITDIVSEKKAACYVIGGYVRDHLLGRPSKDIDFVVAGSGIELAKQVASRLGKKVKVNVFKNFGTAMIKYRDYELEFVGARKESYARNSRKPIVENGTIEEDQKRRDFTINALAVSLNPENFGELIDPFNGLEDLKNKIIRTPLDPGTTYSDDPLRMMRAIRFAVQLNFSVEEYSLKAIFENRERVKIISGERVIDELNKIMATHKPSQGYRLLDKTGLLEIILPELHAMKGVDVKEGKGHKDNFYHSLQVLDNIAAKTDNIWLKWAALLHDVGKPPTKYYDPQTGWTFHGHDYLGSKMIPSVFRRLKLPLGPNLQYVQKLVKLHLRPIALIDEDVTDSAVRRLLFEAGDDIDDLMTLCEADITSKNDAKVRQYLSNFKLVRKKLVEIEEKDHIRNFQPPVDGEIIMKTFGIQPCKEVGVIKNIIKEAILDGKISNNYDEAFDLMLNTGKELGLKPVS